MFKTFTTSALMGSTAVAFGLTVATNSDVAEAASVKQTGAQVSGRKTPRKSTKPKGCKTKGSTSTCGRKGGGSVRIETNSGQAWKPF